MSEKGPVVVSVDAGQWAMYDGGVTWRCCDVMCSSIPSIRSMRAMDVACLCKFNKNTHTDRY